jgi:replicative DNA helicase
MDMLRVPPNNIEAEQSVLGAMLLDKNAISTASEILRSGDFYKEAHGHIFDSIMDLYDRDEPVDLVTLVDNLRSKGILETIGGITYLSNLVSSVPTTANVKYYAKIVEDKSTLRKLIKSSSETMDMCYSAAEEVPHPVRREYQPQGRLPSLCPATTHKAPEPVYYKQDYKTHKPVQ